MKNKPMRLFQLALAAMSAALGAPMPSHADAFGGARNVSVPFDQLPFRPQAPGLPQRVTDLWGDRTKDGGFGQLIELPPGFRSPVHFHSGDFHGVLVKGSWLHEDANGKGIPLPPGSYVRQAGGDLHVDRCVSETPCLLFLFQFSRADFILPPAK
jgi:hypothetical protein